MYLSLSINTAGFVGTAYISEEHRKNDTYMALNIQNSASNILKGRVALSEAVLRKTKLGEFYETVGKSHIIVIKIPS